MEDEDKNSKSVSCFFVSVREIHEYSLNFESLSKQDFLHPSNLQKPVLMSQN